MLTKKSWFASRLQLVVIVVLHASISMQDSYKFSQHEQKRTQKIYIPFSMLEFSSL